MANNKLILRSVQSPWVTPFNDITTNSVLSWGDVDNNFIYLKGELIYSGFTSNNQLILQKINGSQITINGVGGGGSTTDVFVTGGTYNPLNGEATFTNNTGGTFDVGGFFTGDSKSLQEVVNVGNTINNFGGNGDASIQSTNFVNNRTLYLNDDANPTIKIVDNLDGAHKLTIDIDTLTLNNTSYNWLDIINGEIFVTGGTYNPLNGEATFTNNSGGTFDVSGFLTGYTNYYTTGATLNDTILSFDRTDTLSAYTVNLSSLDNYGNKWFVPSGTTVEVKENYQSFIYGDLYIQGTLLLNDNAQLVVLNGDIILSGGSISGNGTTLLVDLPMVDTYITGGTYSNGDLTLVDNFGDDVTINGFYTGSTGNYLPLSGGVMDDNAIIEFNNTSQLREGYNDFGGQGGISQICGLGYENNWQAGINHIFDNNGFIRESKYCFNTIPDNTFDSSSKFKVGSRWVLDNGDVYICSDDTVGSAVWYLEDNDTYVTGGTYFSGGTIIFGYNTGGDFEVSGLTVDLTSQIDGLAEADEQTITLNLTTNKIELKETVASATGGTRTFQGDFAISGGTLNLDTIGSGSPIINLGLDSSGFVVTGTTSIPFTGNTSGDCISDLYVSNLYGCSPITIHDSIQSNGSVTSGNKSFAFGFQTSAIGNQSFAFGYQTSAIGNSSHAEGDETTSGWKGFEVTGITNGVATLDPSYGDVTSEFTGGGVVINYKGVYVYSTSIYNGVSTEIYLNDSLINHGGTYISDINNLNSQYADYVLGSGSHAEGKKSMSLGIFSHSEGYYTISNNEGSHAEGQTTRAFGEGSHSEGRGTSAIGSASHAEGFQTTAIGESAHAEGAYTAANGNQSHTEGYFTTAIEYAHAEGYYTEAIGSASHSEGQFSIASGNASHAEGIGTITDGNYQHAQGMYNATGNTTQGAFILGNGADANNRSNLIFAAGNNVDIYGQLSATTIITDSLTATTIGVSGNCVNDIYVSNIHSCSPLHINPNDEGNVYFGSTSGVTVDLTNHKLVVENIQITSGATDGYVLTSDASGNIALTAPTDGFTYQIGQYVEEEGGVIFHRYKDGANENYLVVAIDDQAGLDCDTISVTYTLVGEEPVTVEVAVFGEIYGKNSYEFVIQGIDVSLFWNVTNWMFINANSEETQATLSSDTPCPFGTYIIGNVSSIFEAFSVAPVLSVWSNITDQLAGSDSTWNGLENSLTITGQTGHAESAAQLCLEYVNGDGGCGVIKVIYQLDGGEPITIEVNSIGVTNGKNYYDITINDLIFKLYWQYNYLGDLSWVFIYESDGSGEDVAFLTQDIECPFGNYNVVNLGTSGLIFDSFIVEPLGKNDWYLPAVDELSLLWQNRFNVNRTLSGYSSFGSISGATQIGYNSYWSSTESDASYAWNFNFDSFTAASNKDLLKYVRAVRKFSI